MNGFPAAVALGLVLFGYLASRPAFSQASPASGIEEATIMMKNGARDSIPPPLPREIGTPLHEAIADRDLAAVSKLLDEGADPDLPNDVGMTPLDLAVMRGYREIVVVLLDRGADIDLVVPGSSVSPIMSAFSYGRMTDDWSIYDEFISRGASVTKRTGSELSSNMVDYAVALREFCRAKELIEDLSEDQLNMLRSSTFLTNFIREPSGRGEREEICRLEMMKILEE